MGRKDRRGALMTAEYDLSMPLDEAMLTRRAIRRLKSDPVPDALVLRLIELALKAPTGSNRQGWEFIIVKDPQRESRAGGVQPAVMGFVRQPGAPGDERRSQAAQDPGGGAVAGGPFRGCPGDPGRLLERPLLSLPAHHHGDVLWLDLPGGAKFTPGSARRRSGGGADDHPDLEPVRRVANWACRGVRRPAP